MKKHSRPQSGLLYRKQPIHVVRHTEDASKEPTVPSNEVAGNPHKSQAVIADKFGVRVYVPGRGAPPRTRPLAIPPPWKNPEIEEAIDKALRKAHAPLDKGRKSWQMRKEQFADDPVVAAIHALIGNGVLHVEKIAKFLDQKNFKRRMSADPFDTPSGHRWIRLRRAKYLRNRTAG